MVAEQQKQHQQNNGNYCIDENAFNDSTAARQTAKSANVNVNNDTPNPPQSSNQNPQQHEGDDEPRLNELPWFLTPLDKILFVATWSIQALNLAESLYTTYNFDDERFDFLWIAFTFTCFPWLDSLVKSVAYCTEATEWDDFVVDLVSEGIQAYLYIYFCSFAIDAKYWLSLLMAGQALLILVVYRKLLWSCSSSLSLWCCCSSSPGRAREAQQENDQPSTTENDNNQEKGHRKSGFWWTSAKFFLGCLSKCFVPSLFAFLLGSVTILYFVTQDDSPFQTTQFKVVFAVYAWIIENSQRVIHDAMLEGYLEQQQQQQFQQQQQQQQRIGENHQHVLDGDDDEASTKNVLPDSFARTAAPVALQQQEMSSPWSFQSNDDDTEELHGQLRVFDKYKIVATKKGRFPLFVNFITSVAMFFYISVLSWMWWFNDDIVELYDKVLAMIYMVTSCFFFCLYYCKTGLKIIDNNSSDGDYLCFVLSFFLFSCGCIMLGAVAIAVVVLGVKDDN
ncbi:hypothetical protein ACA910_001319 [Epithemia clementina (nom. ined.)]